MCCKVFPIHILFISIILIIGNCLYVLSDDVISPGEPTVSTDVQKADRAALDHLDAYAGAPGRTREVQDYMEDLNAQYNWEDIQNGNQLFLSDDDYDQVNMNMNFNFYDQTFTSCYVCSNGMIGFVDDGGWVLYDYENMEYPNAEYPYIIAPLWDDLNPSDGGSIYYQTLQNPLRFVVSWVNIPHYENGGQNSFQVIMYSDSGIIKFNYQALIQQTSSTVGLNMGDGVHFNMPYYYINAPPRDRPSSPGSIRFFITIPPIPDDMSFRGQADFETVCYAEYQEYTISANLTTFEGLNDISEFTILLDYNNTNITLGYNGTHDRFYKTGDPDGHIWLLPASEARNDGTDKWWLDFHVVINFTFPHELAVDCMAVSSGKCGITMDFWFANLFRVENDLELQGSPEFTGEFQGALTEGDWIRGGEGLNVDGLTVSYENDPSLVPDDEHFDVKLEDRSGRTWWVNDTEDGAFSTRIGAKNTSDAGEEYRITIENIPGQGECAQDVTYSLKVDADAPAAPEKLTCHAEDFDDKETSYTGQTVTFVTWDESSDAESGLQGYFISHHDGSGTHEGNFTVETEAEMAGLAEGMASFYVWCVDNVGNAGDAASSGIFVDMTAPTFENFTPGEARWYKDGEIVFSVEICDWGGSGIDGETIEYTVSTRGSGAADFEYWVPFYLQSGDECVNVSGKFNFEEGVDNYIKWRASDMAGNGPVESPVRNVKIDRTPVEFQDTVETRPEWYDSTEITIKIKIGDVGSGVDLESLEACTSVSGPQGFGEWTKIDGEDIAELEEGEYEIGFTATYAEGRGNYVMFRGTDLVGNPLISSDKINLLVDTSTVYFGAFTPDETLYSNELEVDCMVEVHDNGSGVDTGSVEYSISTGGPDENEFGPWKKATNAMTGNPTQIPLTVEFDWGRDNYIRFRANDAVGSGLAVSPSYRIWVNSRPEAKISQPSSEMVVYSDERLTFVGTNSSDADGDNLTFSWTSNLTINSSLGEGVVIEATLAPGMHTITLHVDDGHGYVITDEIYITSKEREKDDGGGLISEALSGDSWSLLILGLVLLLILIILAVVLVVLRRRKKDRDEEDRTGGPATGAGAAEDAARFSPQPIPPARGPPGPPPGAGMPPFQSPPAQPGAAPQSLPSVFQDPQAGATPLPGPMPLLMPPLPDGTAPNLDLMALPPGPGPAPEAEKTPGAVPGITPGEQKETAMPPPQPTPGPATSAPPPAGAPADAPAGAAAGLSSPADTMWKKPSWEKPSWETLLDFENMLDAEGGDAGVVPAMPDLGTPLATPESIPDTTPAPEPAVPESTDPGQAAPEEAGAPEGPGDVVLTCHSCGQDYIANIPEFPIIVVCPMCNTEGRIDSL